MQWTGQQAGLLALLTLSYTVGEVAHFLIAVTSRQVASSIQFGDMKCFTNTTATDCANLPDKQSCEGRAGCRWEYSGQGLQFQVLVGPAFIVVFTISGVVAGFLADRVSRPALLAASVLLFSISLILTGVSSQYWQLVLLRMLTAAGEAALRPAGGSLIAELFPPDQRGIANGIFSWGVYLGYGFSFLFGVYVTRLDVLGWGWRASYILAGLPGIALAAAMLLLPDPRGESGADTPAPPPPLRKLSYGVLERKPVKPTLSNLSQQSSSSAGSQLSSVSYPRLVLTAFSRPAMLLLFLAAAVRHTAGYAWAHNNVSYFSHYHPAADIGYWFILCAMVGGCVGVFAGGYISDRVVVRLGLHSRLWLLGLATVLATPFAALTLHLDPPAAFGTLLLYYFFAETWFSLMFTVLVEIVPAAIRSVCIGSFLFLMNNVGGNLPLLIDPLTKVPGVGLQTALYITWPGLTAASGFLFFLAGIPLWSKWRREQRENCQL